MEIKCPKELNQFIIEEPLFENTFEGKECEAAKFYGDCHHCFATALAKRDKALKVVTKDEHKEGHWIALKNTKNPEEFICDKCGYYINLKNTNLPFVTSPYEEFKFCTNCGSIMKLKQ